MRRQVILDKTRLKFCLLAEFTPEVMWEQAILGAVPVQEDKFVKVRCGHCEGL